MDKKTYYFNFIDRKGKLICKNSLFYSWINYLSVISITRTKVIFHSTNVFVNLIKLMQSVQDERRERENDHSTK
jgi:hypothetical protein